MPLGCSDLGEPASVLVHQSSIHFLKREYIRKDLLFLKIDERNRVAPLVPLVPVICMAWLVNSILDRKTGTSDLTTT